NSGPKERLKGERKIMQQVLEGLESLTEVELSGRALSPGDIAALGEALAANVTVKKLDLSHNSIDDE
ncbi:unnamed protein product, partial [Chrysoparadoxa australica]